MHEKFELTDGLYSVWDNQDYFESILKTSKENVLNLEITEVV